MTLVDLSRAPHERDVAALFRRRSTAAQAIRVLDLLAEAQHPLTRQDIYNELRMSPATLASCMENLEKDGYVVSSRRYAVTLGVRFLGDPVLSRVFRDTMLALTRPHLESLTQRFDGTASIAFSTIDSCLIADACGPTPREQLGRWSSSVLAQAIRGTSQDGVPALSLRGVWAGYAGEDHIVIASRARLRSHCAAAIGLTLRTLTLSEFSDVSQAVSLAASTLSNSLRRVFPLLPPVRDDGSDPT